MPDSIENDMLKGSEFCYLNMKYIYNELILQLFTVLVGCLLSAFKIQQIIFLTAHCDEHPLFSKRPNGK